MLLTRVVALLSSRLNPSGSTRRGPLLFPVQAAGNLEAMELVYRPPTPRFRHRGQLENSEQCRWIAITGEFEEKLCVEQHQLGGNESDDGCDCHWAPGEVEGDERGGGSEEGRELGNWREPGGRRKGGDGDGDLEEREVSNSRCESEP